MMSSTGVITVDTVLLRAIRMPVGRPSTKQTTTERIVTSSRSMLSDQRPKMPKNSIETVTRIVERMPATAQVIQAAMATTPSQPISGTGRGDAGMLMTFCRNSKIALKTSPIVPSTPPKNQLSGPCSCTQSRISLSQVWNPVVSWKPSSRVWLPRRITQRTSQTTTMAEQLQPGAAVLAVLDVRLLLLGGRLARWCGGGRHVRSHFLGHDDAEDVLVVDQADGLVAVDHAARSGRCRARCGRRP